MEETTTPSNPAGAAARTEYAKILSDKTHPMHEGLMRNDPTVNAHIGGLYRKAYPTTDNPQGAESPGEPTSTCSKGNWKPIFKRAAGLERGNTMPKLPTITHGVSLASAGQGTPTYGGGTGQAA